MKATLKENLLVTFGARAAVLDSLGHIELPAHSSGEDELADFAVSVCNQWIDRDDNDCLSFDEFIETALIEKWGSDRRPEWFGVVRWCEDDIRAELYNLGYEDTPEAISLIRTKMEHGSFTGGMIETGWDYIHAYIQSESDNLTPLDYE